MVFVSYEEMYLANKQGRCLQRLSDELLEEDVDSFIEQLHLLQCRLRQENMHKILDRYLVEAKKVLEVGAGVLDPSGRSFFNRSTPLPQTTSFFYCDANPQLAELYPEVLCVDMTELSSYFPANTFSHVLSANALDTLNQAHLFNALKSIEKVLSPNGLLVHALNYEPYLYAFYNDMAQKYPRAIPFKNTHNTHNAFICSSKKVTHPLLEISESLSPILREQLWQGLLAMDKENVLQQLAERRTEEGFVINAFQWHVEMYMEVLKTIGFQEISQEEITIQETVTVPETSQMNQLKVSCGPDGVTSTRTDLLEKFQVEMKTCCLVAKKGSI